jgi:hypothetical protein
VIHLADSLSSEINWHIKPDSQAQDHSAAPLDAIKTAVAGFSAYLFKHPTAREFPEIVALAFWFRQAHLDQITVELKCHQIHRQVKRVFHIAPANVDTVFMYSVLLSALCGNKNVVRVSQRSGDATWLLIALLRNYLTLAEGSDLAPLIGVLEYDALHQQITEQLSHWCDLRVIWGGDNAITAISGIVPQTPQICFPDRYSVTVLELSREADFAKHARAFLADVVPFTQQACSSPKAIYWLNTDVESQTQFWLQVGLALESISHKFEMSHKVEQHIQLQKLAASYGMTLWQHTGNKHGSFARIQNVGPLSHCKVKSLTAGVLEAHDGNGLVLEQDIASVEEVACSSKLQTIGYAVARDWQDPNGQFKRVVPVGKALEFAPVWDGVNLIQAFGQ